MNLSGNTVLITGGGSGIGFALAKRFIEADNKVIIVGRREEKLLEAKEKLPSLHTRVCNLSDESDRQTLYSWIKNEHPELNVLVNNAGIQQKVNLQKGNKPWEYYRNEITTNLDAPIHLCLLLLPTLVEKETAAIINVSSGLAITPGVWVPIYSATKAAVHSFSVSLRHQLSDTNIDVIEVLPPAVNTDLGGVGLHTFGAPLDDFADKVFNGFKNGDLEIGFGDSEKRLRFSMEEIRERTKLSWENYLKRNPDFL